MTALNELTASAAAELIRRGETTSEALVAACLARIAEADGGIGAFAALDPDYATEQARAADTARARGDALGDLHGVPIAIKDVIDTRDFPTENGCPVFSGRHPEHDAFCVSALRAAGAVIIGKTVSTELALLTPSGVKNPVAPGRSPGGSSAGSAAAVAAHMVPAALGTQTAGSVLRPASYCGLVGFKPTLGLVSRRGVLMQSHTLDTVGMLARTIEDAALVADCIAVYDPGDDIARPRSAPRLAHVAATEPPARPRLAFVKTPAWPQASASLHAAYGDLVARLGGDVDEIELPVLPDVIEWQRLVQLAENAAYYGPLLDAHPALISKGLTERLQLGSAVPVRKYLEAIMALPSAYAEVARVLDRYDAMLTPASPGPAPRLEDGITGSPIFNGLWTWLGMPAISLPLLEAEGLPLGVQLVGRRHEDGKLLRTARWLTARVEAMASLPG
jgi:Asp-tRNA(Asn)/Glu-tRNA(Gln) amidotransferase A subunit family amidase